MADIQITDDLGKSVPDVKIDLSHPSSLLKYAKNEILHLIVVPDFVERAREPLSTAASNPISFHLALQHGFQLGNARPEINLTPSFDAIMGANATRGSNLFEDEPFPVASTVPGQTGYVSLSLQGSLDLGVSGSSGDLTFGIEENQAIALEYWKAFPLGAGEPTLGEAAGKTISGFVIPADIDDLRLLNLNDVATVAGQGSLKISAKFQISAVPNPLASVDLPLNAGTFSVKSGVVAGIAASFTIAGSWQMRVRRTAAEVIELSFYKEKGTTSKTDLSASAGVSAKAGDADLLKELLSAISTDPNDDATKKLFAAGGLSQEEIDTLTGAIKEGLDHSLAASIDLALSQTADHEAAFQYEIRPAQLNEVAGGAVRSALRGDLSGLTMLENASDDAVLAPGVKLIASVLTTVRKNQTVFRLNLLGLVNYMSLAELIQKSVVVKDPATGYLTITDRTTGRRINSEVEPQRRREALRKAMFESLMVTAAYRVSKAIDMTGLSGHNFHFAFDDSTKRATARGYLNWFVVMNLLTKAQQDEYLQQFEGDGPSTCLLRTEFDDGACESLFFQAGDTLWGRDHYLDIGRRAMLALIDRSGSEYDSDTDRFRYEMLDQHWQEAVGIGPVDDLGSLVGLHPTDSNGMRIMPYLKSDVYTIVWWANAMRTVGEAVLDMRQFLASNGATQAEGSQEFVRRREQLQKTMAGMIGKSQTRFGDPWGLISLLWAAGSRGASGSLVARGIAVRKPDLAIAAG